MLAVPPGDMPLCGNSTLSTARGESSLWESLTRGLFLWLTAPSAGESLTKYNVQRSIASVSMAFVSASTVWSISPVPGTP